VLSIYYSDTAYPNGYNKTVKRWNYHKEQILRSSINTGRRHGSLYYNRSDMKIINIGNRVVNNYLVQLPDGWLVIDTGYPNGYNTFKRKLNKSGIHEKDIRYIFITHAHDDHVGFLNELIENTDATVIMHHETPERLLAGHNKYKGGCSNKLAKFFVNGMGFLGKAEHSFPVVTIPANTLIWDGHHQLLKEKGYDIEIIPLPGHTSDHIGLLVGDNLFCGDAAMNGFPSIKRNIIWIEELKSYCHSWETMINSRAEAIYPSHGNSFPKSDLIRFYRHLDTIKLHKTRLSVE